MMEDVTRKRVGSIGTAVNENMAPYMMGEAMASLTLPATIHETSLPNDPDSTASGNPAVHWYSGLKSVFYNRAMLAHPISFFFFLCVGLYGPVWNELTKIKVCEIVYSHSANFCAQIGQDTEHPVEVDKIRSTTTDYLMYGTLISSIPSAIFTLFVGSWSDRYGRKTPMVLALIGFMLPCAVILPVAYLPIHPLYLLIASGLYSLLGGWPVFISSVTSYIGDHTDEKNRSTVIAINMAFLGFGLSAGLKIGTLLLQHYGFPVPFYVYLGVLCTTVAYILVLIKDHTDFDSPENQKISHMTKARGVFQLQSVKDNWNLLRNKRVGNARSHILLLLGSYTAAVMCIENEGTILQQLTEYQPLSWTVGEYGSFSSIQGIAGCVALIVFIPIFKRVLKLSDTTMGVVSSISGVFCAYGYAISVYSWMVYTAMSIGLIRQLSFVCMQSVLIALVDRTEVGKMMSIVGSVQALSQIVSVVLFLKIFAVTAAWWPGFVFALMAFVLLCPLVAFCIIDATLVHVSS